MFGVVFNICSIFVTVFFEEGGEFGIFLMIVEKKLTKGGGSEAGFFVFLHEI